MPQEGDVIRRKMRGDDGVFVDAVMMDIDSIIPYEKNAKTHPRDQVERIAKSIEKYGFDQPIVVDEDMVIIKGHGRRLASLLLGLKQVPVIVRTDMTEAQKKASRIADNQTAESHWNIGALLAEMEALHESGYDVEDTGYSLDEVRTMCPGLLETDEDYEIDAGEGGAVPGAFDYGTDGKIGEPIRGESGSKLSLKEWVSMHETVIVPFSGDKAGLAALVWCIANGFKDRLTVIDTNFGQRNWSFHDEYMSYVAEKLGIEISRVRNRVDEWQSEIKERGFPTKERPWCCIAYRQAGVADIVGMSKSPIVVFGNADDRAYRTIGTLPDLGDYAAPFCTSPENKQIEIIEKAGILLNPLYKVTTKYLCPMCPMYERPDHAFLREFDLDLWIRWMVYFGKSQYCQSFMASGEFNDMAIKFIAESIQPRDISPLAPYAMELKEPKQPVREAIVPGDDYGWDGDTGLEHPDRLDVPYGRWWEDEEHSPAFKAQMRSLERYKEERGDTPLDEWLYTKIAEAKKVAEEEGLR